MPAINATTATATVEVVMDTRLIEHAMLVIAKHFEACATELAASRGDQGEGA